MREIQRPHTAQKVSKSSPQSQSWIRVQPCIVERPQAFVHSLCCILTSATPHVLAEQNRLNMASPSIKCAVLIHEDRPAYETGMRILLLSLKEHFPAATPIVHAPNASADFSSWVQDSGIQLVRDRISTKGGWNIKPDLLMWGLSQGYERVVFLDSDIVVNRDPSSLFLVPKDQLSVAELGHPLSISTKSLSKFWGLTPHRNFYRSPSGCAIGASVEHTELLQQWSSLLSREDYQYWQSLPLKQRPPAARGDDEILATLLGSSEFGDVSLRTIDSSGEIAQCLSPSDYSCVARIHNFLGKGPILVHAMGKKPWLVSTQTHDQTYYSMSPYTCVARKYKEQLPPSHRRWMNESRLSRYWLAMTRGNPAAATFPHAFIDTVQRFGLRSTFKQMRNYLESVR